MKRLKFNKGDKAWLHNGGEVNLLIEGKVIEILNLDGYNLEHYVVAVPTSVDDLLLVRNGITLTDDPEKPIGMWRK